MSYFVKIPTQYRRPSKKRVQACQGSKELALKTYLPPVWSFHTEVEAIDFVKAEKNLWLEVWFEGKVIYKNFNPKPVWLTLEQAAAIREHNAKVNEQNNINYEYVPSKKARRI